MMANIHQINFQIQSLRIPILAARHLQRFQRRCHMTVIHSMQFRPNAVGRFGDNTYPNPFSADRISKNSFLQSSAIKPSAANAWNGPLFSGSSSFGAPCKNSSNRSSKRYIGHRSGNIGDGGGGSGGGGGGSGGGRGQGDDKHGDSRGPQKYNVKDLWDTYLRLLEEAPIMTKAISTAILNGLGDMIAQILIEQRHSRADWDLRRFGVQCFLGGVLIGPTLHVWYTFINSIFPSRDIAGTVKRVVIDQFGFAPLFLPLFLFSLYSLEGRHETMFQDISMQWIPVVVANWKIWIPFQFINFRFVPPRLQVMAANACAIAWNTYLSYTSHNTTPRADAVVSSEA